MIHPHLRWLLPVLLAGLLPGGVRGQDVPSPYRFVEKGQGIGAFVGVFSPDRGRFGFGPGPGLFYGARYGVSVSGPVALEAAVGPFVTERDVVNPARVEGDRVIAEAAAGYVLGDVRLRLDLTGRRTWKGITPFLFLGGGLLVDVAGGEPEDEPLEPDDRVDPGTEFLADFGGGVRYLVGDRWALRADLFLALFQIDIPEGYRDPDRDFEAVPESEWVSGSGLTLGLSYLF
jgi:hypothetical protein